MPFPGVNLNPTENFLIIPSADQLPDILNRFCLYNLLYDPGTGQGLYYTNDEVTLVKVAGSSGGNFTFNIPQTGYVDPAGASDRTILQYDFADSRWEERSNLNLPDTGYIRLYDSLSASGQIDFDGGDFNLTDITALNLEQDDIIEWADLDFLQRTDSGGTVTVEIFNSTQNPAFVEFASTPGVFYTYADNSLSGLTDGSTYLLIVQGSCGDNSAFVTVECQTAQTNGAFSSSLVSGQSAHSFPGLDTRTHYYQWAGEITSDGTDIVAQYRGNPSGTPASSGFDFYALDVTNLTAAQYKSDFSAGSFTVNRTEGQKASAASVTVDDDGDYMVYAMGRAGSATVSGLQQWLWIGDGTNDYTVSGCRMRTGTKTCAGGVLFKNVTAGTTFVTKHQCAFATNDSQTITVDYAFIAAVRVDELDNYQSTVEYNQTFTNDSDFTDLYTWAVTSFTVPATGTYKVEAAINNDQNGATQTPSKLVAYNVDTATETTLGNPAGFHLEDTAQMGRINFGTFTANAGEVVKLALTGNGASSKTATASIVVSSQTIQLGVDTFSVGNATVPTEIRGTAVTVIPPTNFDAAVTMDSTLNVLGAVDIAGLSTFSGNAVFDGDVTFNGATSGLSFFDMPSGDKLTGVDTDSVVQDVAQVKLGTISGDPDFELVNLRCDFNGADGAMAFSDQSLAGNTLTFNGAAQLDNTVAKFGTTSLLFGASNDYVDVTSDTSLTLADFDWKIECFIYFNGLGNFQPFYDQRTNTADVGPVLYKSDTNQLRYYTNSADRITGSTLTSGQWYHICLSRVNGTTRLFLDGTQDGSSYTDGNTYVQNPVRLGTFADNTSLGMNGNLDDLRVTIGSGVSADFTVPAEAYPITDPTYNPNFANVGLLCRFNGSDGDTTSTDESNNAIALTFNGSAAIDTAQFKYGGSSLLIPNTSGSYVSVASDAAITLGSGDWTIRCWVRLENASGSAQFIYDQRQTGVGTSTHPTIFVNSSNNLIYYANGATRITSSSTLAADTWYRIAICKDGTTTRMFIGGALEGSFTDSITYTAGRAIIGSAGDNTANSPLDGWIDDFEVNVGDALYPNRHNISLLTLPNNVGVEDNVTIGDADLETEILGSEVRIPTAFQPPIYTDSTRPAATNGVQVIYNSDDGQLNISDGTNWTLPDGTVT